MSHEIMQQALDALEFPHDSEWSNKAKAIEALQHALAQPEQEPVAWKYDWYGHKSEKEPRVLIKDWIASVYSEVSDPTINAHNIRPLYAAPPRKEWVGLTDDEIKKIMQRWRNGYIDIKDVEQLLKDKNDTI